MTGNIVVYFRGGTYWLDETFTLGADDSGNNGYEVVYRAYPGEHPVWSGGSEITGWTNEGGGVYSAGTAGLDEFRQLYVDDRRAVRARTPNAGEFNRIREWDKTNKKLVVDADDVADFPTLGAGSNVEMVVQTQWSDQHLKVESVQTNGGAASVDTREHERNTLFARANPGNDPGASYHFENAYEFMDTNAEFFLDTANDTVYYRPRFDEDMTTAKVVAPQLVTLLQVEGTIGEPAAAIRFEGLSFEHSGWNVPSEEGYLDKQAGVYEYNLGWERKMPSAVLVRYADRIAFEGNRFERLGASGLDLETATADVSIVGNVFADISGNGMNIESTLPREKTPPADPETIVRRTLVANNYITQVGQDYFGSVGIYAGYPEALTVEHNEIAYLPYSGISLGWGWTSNDTALKENIVRSNEIHHVMQVLVDGAGIYTLSKQPDSQIAENYVHDLGRSAWASPYLDPTKNHYPTVGIYLDLNSAGFAVTDNVIENVHTPLFANRFKYGSNTFSGNDGHDEAIKSAAGLEPAYAPLRDSVYDRDSTRPALTGAKAEFDGRHLVLTFGEAIDPDTLQASLITLGGTTATVAAAELDTNVPANDTIRLELNGTLPYMQPVILSLNPGAVRDGNGNPNGPLAGFAVDTDEVQNPYVVHLDVTGSPILSVGGAVYLHPAAQTRDGAPVLPAPASWQFASADPSVATVDANGHVTAVAAGETTVTVSAVVDGPVDVPVSVDFDIFVFAGGEPLPRLVNIAEGKDAEATGTSAGAGYGPDKAADGDIDTIWALSTEGTLTIDLGDSYSLYDIEQIQVATRLDFDQKTPRQNFEVQASDSKDFTDMTVLGAQGEVELPFGGVKDIDLTSPRPYRYIRFVKLGGYAVVAELRVNASFRQAGTAPIWPTFATLQASEQEAGQVRLSWSPPSDFYETTGYSISVNGGTPVTVNGDVYSHVIDGVTEGVPLTATVQAINAFGTSADGPSVTIVPSWSGYYADVAWSESPIMLTGETMTLRPAVRNADNRPVTWGTPMWTFSSSNASVASVNGDGVVTALSSGSGGQTQITASGSLNGTVYTTALDVFVFPSSQPRPTEVNLAKAKPVTASVANVAGHVKERAVDGSVSTMWATSVPGYLQIDLGDSSRYYDIVAVEITTRQDADLQSPRRNFDFYGSADPSFASPTLLASQGATALAYRETKRYDLPAPAGYPYIRFVKTGNYAEVAELRVWATVKVKVPD